MIAFISLQVQSMQYLMVLNWIKLKIRCRISKIILIGALLGLLRYKVQADNMQPKGSAIKRIGQKLSTGIELVTTRNLLIEPK